MHYTHFYPRSGFFSDGAYGIWTNPYFWVPKLIGLVLLTVACILVVRAFRNRNSFMNQHHSEAIDLLKLKFVNGEIDEETYRKKMVILK